MNAPHHLQILLGTDPPDEPQLPLSTEGVACYVWEGRFGPMLIEVKDGASYVNGVRVEPFSSPLPSSPSLPVVK